MSLNKNNPFNNKSYDAINIPLGGEPIQTQQTNQNPMPSHINQSTMHNNQATMHNNQVPVHTSNLTSKNGMENLINLVNNPSKQIQEFENEKRKERDAQELFQKIFNNVDM